MFDIKQRASLSQKQSLNKCLTRNDELEEDQYIFYTKSKKIPATKIELEVRLNSDERARVKILIDIKSTIQFLSLKIADFMENFPTYTNLEGLKAINIKRKTEKGAVDLPNDDIFEVKDFLDNGNIIYCDLQTDEFWVNSKINLLANSREFSTSLEIKLKLKLKIKDLKGILIKKALNLWSDCSKNDNLYYVFVDASCYTKNSLKDLNFRIENLSIPDEFDELLVGDVFTFKSQLIVDFRLISIEELIFDELFQNAKSIKEKFGEFMSTYFHEFITSEKFEMEYKTVKKLTQKFIKSQLSNISHNPLNIEKMSESKTLSLENEPKYHSLVVIPPIDKAKYESKGINDDIFDIILKPIESEFKAKSIDNYNETVSAIVKSKENFDCTTTHYSLHLKETLLKGNLETNRKNHKQQNHHIPVIQTEVLKHVNNEKSPKSLNSGFFLGTKNRMKSNKSLSLCSEIIDLIKIEKIGELVDLHSKIRICSYLMESIEIPQFRNFRLNTNPEKRSFINSESNISRKSSFIEDNFHKRTLIFISILLVIFTVVVVLVMKFFN